MPVLANGEHMQTWIYGYFGHRNLGDEAILESVLSGLRGVGQNPRVFTSNVAASEQAMAASYVLAPPLDAKSDLPGIKSRVGYLLRNGRHWLPFLLSNGNACIYACGGSINDHVPGRVALIRNRVARLKGLGFRVGILGAGVNALVNDADRNAAYETVMTLLDYCSVRDEDSSEVLKGLDIPPDRYHVAADAAFALDAPARWSFRPGPLGDKLVGLNLRPLFENEKERGEHKDRRRADYIRSAQALIVNLARNARAVELIALSPDDFSFLQRFELPRNATIVPLPRNRLQVMTRIAHLDVFVGSRFHAFVFAAMAGVPCVVIPYSPKVISLARAIGVEYESLIVGDGGELAARDLDPEAVCIEVERTWAAANEVSGRFLSFSALQSKLARHDLLRCWSALRE